MTDILADLSARVGQAGINLVGATRVAAYDSHVVPARRVAPRAPGARSAIVLGNGGGALWEAARAHLAGAWTDDPLDRFTRDIWKRFDHTDLEPLKAAILRRREQL